MLDRMIRCAAFVAGVLIALLAAVPASAAEGAGQGRTLAVVAVQARLQFDRTPEAFAARMGKLVEDAVRYRPDLIVFPEDIGTPLISLGDHEAVEGAKGLKEAATRIAMRHAAEVAALCARHQVSPIRALWLVKAEAIRKTYEGTFSSLARKHRVTLVAGSTPWVFPDRSGDVFNVCFLFAPDGTKHELSRKVTLVDLEKAAGLDLSAGTIDDYHVYRMPRAVIGSLVCADAWHPELAQRLVEQGAEVLLQVSANPEVWSPGHREGWNKSLFSRVQELGVYGVQCMGIGQLLDLPFQGQSQIVAPKAWTANGSGVLAEARTPTEEEILFAKLDVGWLAR